MIDFVEARIIAGQIAIHLMGKRIVQAQKNEKKKGSMRDAFLLRVKPEIFRTSLEGATLSDAYAKYRHVIIETDRGTGLDFWDVYGKILYIEKDAKTPGNPPIWLGFEDGSKLIILSGVWGNMSLVPNDKLRTFRDSSDPAILDTSSENFTLAALTGLLHNDVFEKSIIKEVLTRYKTPCIVSVMGNYSQEALYRAKLHPKRKVKSLTEAEIARLYTAIREVTADSIAAGGRASERDLFDRPGGFLPAVSQATEGKPCPKCGATIQSIKLGGAGKYYICPGCQPLL